MKNLKVSLLLSVIFCSIFCSISLFGQSSDKLSLSAIDFSTGKSALGSGFYVNLNLSSDKNVLQMTFAEEKIFLNYFFKVNSLKVKIGPTGGYFQNVPFTGAIATWTPCKVFSTLHWVGYSFGDLGGKVSLDPSFLFAINTANIDVWRFRLSYSSVAFQKTYKDVVTLRYSQKLTESFSGYTDLGYDMTNKLQLLKAGVNYKF